MKITHRESEERVHMNNHWPKGGGWFLREDLLCLVASLGMVRFRVGLFVARGKGVGVVIVRGAVFCFKVYLFNGVGGICASKL